LDELKLEIEPSLGVSMVRLVVESQKSALTQAKGLIAKAQREVGDRWEYVCLKGSRLGHICSAMDLLLKTMDYVST
jgi:hypothetical protein